jgi:hypothetical protein
MRILIIMAVTVCWLCVHVNQSVQSMRAASDGRPVTLLPPVTQPELQAALAARAELIRSGALARYGTPPAAAADEDPVYRLREERGYMGIDSDWLDERFDANDRLSAYQIVRD